MAQPLRSQPQPLADKNLTESAARVPTAGESRGHDAPTVQLIRGLFSELGELLRSEANVVKMEVQESMRAMLVSSVKATVAAGVALLGVLSLLAFLIIGLGDLIAGEETQATAFWVSALIIGIIFTAGGAYFAMRFGKQIGAEASLPRSQEELRADRRMMQQEMSKLKEAAKP